MILAYNLIRTLLFPLFYKNQYDLYVLQGPQPLRQSLEPDWTKVLVRRTILVCSNVEVQNENKFKNCMLLTIIISTLTTVMEVFDLLSYRLLKSVFHFYHKLVLNLLIASEFTCNLSIKPIIIANNANNS